MQPVSDIVTDLLAFLDASPSPSHARREVEQRLRARNYTALDEREHWEGRPGHRGYVVRAGKSLVAFELGTVPPEEGGFLIVLAHTDSPNLRLRPLFERRAAGVLQAVVEPYGSPLFSTWFDRGLCLAGQVVTNRGETVLVHWNRPVAVVSSLAIHLQRDVNKTGLVIDSEKDLRPLLGLALEPSGASLMSQIALAVGHTLEREIGVDELSAAELGFLDAARAELVGLDSSLLSSGRIDNLLSCHAAQAAFLAEKPPSHATRVLALHDHEEVGSRSASGAASPFLLDVLERLCSLSASTDPQARHRAFSRSFLLSADMAHAVHPNFENRHEEQHRPLLGRGPVLKTNSNQAYATDPQGSATFLRACRAAGFTPQHFVSRNDVACGSTVGPITTARTGIRGVDVGNPMLAMHSCRELAAVADVEPYLAALTEWYKLDELSVPWD